MSLDTIQWPPHLGGLFISHNQHHEYYETIEQALYGTITYPTYDPADFSDPTEIAKAIATDSVWTIQWYPNTPIGFKRVHAATLDKALADALSVV